MLSTSPIQSFTQSFIYQQHNKMPVLTPARASPLAEPKVCVVTGSSRGIGKSIALALAKEGQRVVINDLKGQEEVANETAAEVEAAGGEAFVVSPRPVDISLRLTSNRASLVVSFKCSVCKTDTIAC